MAEPSIRMINAPNRSNIMIIGVSHHFLRTLKKSKNSLIIENLLTLSPFAQIIHLS